MLAYLQGVLAPYYSYIKLVHLIATTVWLWSTAVGYAFYLVPVFKAWRRNPGDAGVVALRDWVMERFDHGVIYEHIAFPVVLITGPMLWLAGGWSTGAGWLLLKLLIVVSVFLPIEGFDYYLTQQGGNKARLRAAGDDASYERGVQRHWWFLLITSGPVIVFGVIVLFLATVKPF